MIDLHYMSREKLIEELDLEKMSKEQLIEKIGRLESEREDLIREITGLDGALVFLKKMHYEAMRMLCIQEEKNRTLERQKDEEMGKHNQTVYEEVTVMKNVIDMYKNELEKQFADRARQKFSDDEKARKKARSN